MKVRELPMVVMEILKKLEASPKLVAHLSLVHEVAYILTNRIENLWPALDYDKEAVLIGAATHDIGKTLYKDELTKPGKQHEEIGPDLLIKNGLSEEHARFAKTHARWSQENATLEDLLVAFSDKIWKGQRDQNLEMALSTKIANSCKEEVWETYIKLDELANEITKDADARINWQSQYSV